MTYTIYLSDYAKEQLDFYKKSGEVKKLKKIGSLIEELEVHPRTGTGKPERLKGQLSGFYSRRIDKKNRMIYSIKDDKIIVDVLSVEGHYGDK